jgi:hypothetical protein
MPDPLAAPNEEQNEVLSSETEDDDGLFFLRNCRNPGDLAVVMEGIVLHLPGYSG